MIAVIIQARMTSTRFPGKVMAELGGKPVLQRVIERARMIPCLKVGDKVIVAFPAGGASRPIIELIDKMDCRGYGGSEYDVLERYWWGAYIYGCINPRDVVVRITADCPFIDPVVCGEVIELLRKKHLDYVSNVFPDRTYPQGLDCEAFTWECLDAARQSVELSDTYAREHVTPWMQRTYGIRRACVKQREDMSDLNWCVDFPSDIKRLSSIMERQDKILTLDREIRRDRAN